ncbi:ATP-binding protein [Streptomyces griseocarneus]|uniref:ATP-binding protein n=1 Tax=Streptomyces griseocarneus TaxID=51201 RepID=UPI0019B91880|nr:ATP-binding protein [Streptomyces griseocarneus]GHG45316.1 hypothetical protein GCM10018779_01190 [Streptomyces griseocarneus]
MSHHIPEVVIWCLAIALTAVSVLLARQRTITTGVRRRVDQLEDSLKARDEELAHLVGVRLPAVSDAVSQDVPLPGPLDDRLAGTAFAQNLQSVMDLFTQAVDKAQSRADQSAKAALKASMRALQGLAHEQQLAISEMQDRHDNPDVLRDLLEIDHANSQFGRRAQAIAVLCGSWPGRQRVASQLTDVVRGATSRIRDYRRVRVHSHADIAVVSRAVEPVVLAVAELLDNAARHSQPNTTVEVSIQPVHNGACVVIDDAGVGMDEQEIQQATAMLTGRRVVDVSRLGDPPQFGHPVIGVLAARYGFSVSVDTRSPFGGVRAVLFLPSALLTQLDIDGPGTTPLAARGGRGRDASDRPRRPSRPRAAGRHAERTHAPQAPQAPQAPHVPEPPARPAGAPAPAAAGDTGPRFPGTGEAPGTPGAPGFPDAPVVPDFPRVPEVPDFPRVPEVLGFPDTPAASSPPEAPGGTDAPGGPHVIGSTAGGLPKRRRRQPGGGQRSRPPAPAPTEMPKERTAEETARRMGAFARGTRTGRTGSHQLPPLPPPGDGPQGPPPPVPPSGHGPGHGPGPRQGPPPPPGSVPPPGRRPGHAPVEDEGNPYA